MDEREEVNVKEYIKKIDICKIISELNVKFILNGGAMRNAVIERIKASSSIKVLQARRNHHSNYGRIC